MFCINFVSIVLYLECEEGDVRIYNETYSYNEDGVFVTGIPQRCELGTWSSLCNDGSVPYNAAELICSDNGYQGNNYIHFYE